MSARGFLRSLFAGKFRSLGSNQGVGLVEILVVGALAAILLLALSQFMAQLFRGQKHISQKGSANSVFLSLQGFLASQESCALALLHTPIQFDSSNPAAVVNVSVRVPNSGTDWLVANQTIDLDIRVNALSLNNFIAGAGNAYTADLVLVFGKLGRTIAGESFPPKITKMTLATSLVGAGPMRRIDACFMQSGQSQQPALPSLSQFVLDSGILGNGEKNFGTAWGVVDMTAVDSQAGSYSMQVVRIDESSARAVGFGYDPPAKASKLETTISKGSDWKCVGGAGVEGPLCVRMFADGGLKAKGPNDATGVTKYTSYK